MIQRDHARPSVTNLFYFAKMRRESSAVNIYEFGVQDVGFHSRRNNTSMLNQTRPTKIDAARLLRHLAATVYCGGGGERTGRGGGVLLAWLL